MEADGSCCSARSIVTLPTSVKRGEHSFLHPLPQTGDRGTVASDRSMEKALSRSSADGEYVKVDTHEDEEIAVNSACSLDSAKKEGFWATVMDYKAMPDSDKANYELVSRGSAFSLQRQKFLTCMAPLIVSHRARAQKPVTKALKRREKAAEDNKRINASTVWQTFRIDLASTGMFGRCTNAHTRTDAVFVHLPLERRAILRSTYRSFMNEDGLLFARSVTQLFNREPTLMATQEQSI